ncbi:MAG: Ku protein [Myxococcales bacterium]|nr:Ku protein [Myxococcales bacterium]
MARALAGATISFGLVSIPVKLYSATEASAAVSFNMLHAKCGTRVKQQYYCPKDNESVSRADMVKGYEFAKDQYVTFTPEELKALEENATQLIEIAQFVPAAAIDPVYFDKAYYLGPEKGGEKAYQLLAQAMRASGRTALARYAARGKQYLVMVRPTIEEPGGLVMQQLLYADEVRSFSDVPLAGADVREAELKLARQLIDQITVETFEPTLYHDDVRERIQADIKRKMEGQDIATSQPEQAPARIIDLMEALKASLASVPADGKPSNDAAEADDRNDDRNDVRNDDRNDDRKGARRSAAHEAKAEPKRSRAKR